MRGIVQCVKATPTHSRSSADTAAPEAVPMRYLASRLRRTALTTMKATMPTQTKPETTAPCTNSGEQ